MPDHGQSARAARPGSLVAVPLPNGTYGVIWILEAGKTFAFLIMDGFWPSLPATEDLSRVRVAEVPGGVLPGEENVWKGWFAGVLPKGFRVVGDRKLSLRERRLRRPEGTMVFQGGDHLRTELHRAWRLVHDRPAIEAEWARQDAARKKRDAERARTRTLPRMLRERTFVHGSGTWPAAVVREAKRIFRDATRELIALEKRGSRRQRTAVLKRIVTEFNALDDQQGCIETVEREEIVARVEELAAIVGLTNADEELTGHRDW